MDEPIYVALDLEMTGLDAGEDEIIEIGAVKFQGETVLATFKTFVKPHRSLPLRITRITGITEEHLANAPTFNEVAVDLTRFIGNYPLIGHSFYRDKAMLEAQGMTIPQPVYDTFDMATLLMPHVSTYKLVTLAQHFNIPYSDAHRAYNDADITRQVFLRLYERIKVIDIKVLTTLNRLMAQADWYLQDLFSLIEREKVRAVFQDDPLAKQEPTAYDADAINMPLFWDKQASPGQDNPLTPTGNNTPLDIGEIGSFFAPNGTMSQIFEHYEMRLQQMQMAQKIAQSFNDGTALLIEAGTGTGKSMAYLLPAAVYALQRGERVVISTNTINLQDQLFFKDIPDVKRIVQDYYATKRTSSQIHTPSLLISVLLKGRSNYLCLQRYQRLLRSDNARPPEEARLLLKIHFWREVTTSGDGAEMLLSDNERKMWSSVNVPADTCLGRKCQYYLDCYFYRARRAADSAHLVVVNHALMLADVQVDNGILPLYDHLVVDEAHMLEDVATDQLSFVIDKASLLQYFDSLSKSNTAYGPAGLLSQLQTSFQTGAVGQDNIDTLTTLTSELDAKLERAQEMIVDSFEYMADFVLKETAKSTNGQQDYSYDVRLRMTPAIRRKDGWDKLAMTWESLHLALKPIEESLEEIEKLLIKVESFDVADYDELLLQTQALHRYSTEIRNNLAYIMSGNEEKICWLTLNHSQDKITINIAPLTVADILAANLFSQKQTAIFTSATLSINDSFSFIKERLGLNEAEELQLDSPFDFETQAMVYIPNDMPEPNQRGYQQKLEEALIQLCTATGGRTLALFTANSAIRRTRTKIQDVLEDRNITVLGQGIDGSRRHILEQFKEWSRTVLLGTSSFWQGVDIVGDALSVLVITKLPFQVPTDPIFAARSEQFTDPFHQYAVPNSILRFKQGFGRLIRSKQDRGIVVVLDRRLLSKRYGAEFLQSLPATSVREGPLKHLPTIATRFLGDVINENDQESTR